MNQFLKYLTFEDQAVIIESSSRLSYQKNEVVIAEGESANQVFSISSGIARVEVKGIIIARMGPGELFGEISFLEQSKASATVIAETELGVDVIEWGNLNTLLASVPGLATRFYASLAVMLSDRFRQRTKALASTSVIATMPQSRFPNLPRTGHLSVEQIPTSLASLIKQFQSNLETVEQMDNSLSTTEAKQQVFAACQDFHQALSHSVVEHPEHAQGIGAYLFRQAFPYLMQGRINDMAYTRPHGYAADYETLQLITANEPQGDGPLGVVIDEWTLSLPFLVAVRERSPFIAEEILKMATEWKGVVSLPVTCLANGTSGDSVEILKALKDFGQIELVCIDMEPSAFKQPLTLIEELGMTESVSFVHDNITQFGTGSERTFLHAQKVIFSSAILEFLEEEEIIRLLDWIYAHLIPGGYVILGQTHESNPNRAYLEHIWEWPIHHRNEEDLRQMFAQTKFEEKQLRIEYRSNGTQMFAICQKYRPVD